jgi:DNA-directed RNA polymerase subunit K/omega
MSTKKSKVIKTRNVKKTTDTKKPANDTKKTTDTKKPANDTKKTTDTKKPADQHIVIPQIRKMKEKYGFQPEPKIDIVFVAPENRVMSEIMTKFEYTDVISVRAKQIENGGQCYTDVGNIDDPLAMAKKEIIDKKCPLDIKRPLTDKISERWHVNEMSIPDF